MLAALVVAPAQFCVAAESFEFVAEHLPEVAMDNRFAVLPLWTAALMAVPLPRRGIQGRITGPGFDLNGDTAEAGHGTHFGDTSVTLGLDVTYEPWGLTVDLGSLVSQALVEPLIHLGVDRNWVISIRKRF